MTNSDSGLVTQLANLGKARDYYNAGKLLATQTDEAICKLVEDDLSATAAANTGSNTLTMLIFKSGSTLFERGSGALGDRILGIACGTCVCQICEESGSADEPEGQRWAGISDKLLEVLPLLQPRSVIDIAFRILAELKTSGSLPSAFGNYLPMLLDTLGVIGNVEITAEDLGGLEHGGSVTRTGAELKAYWIDSACSYKWHGQAAARISAGLRETALSTSQIEIVGRRILRQLNAVSELNELPAMVYQLLLLSRHGSKQEIVSGIFSFFENLEQTNGTQALWDIEGTVMLHIGYSIKQDFELGQALETYAREQGDDLTAFSFACLLSLARIHRFSDAVMDILRKLLVSSEHDADVRAATVWARPYLAKASLDVRQLLKSVAERASFGWEQVTQALVQLCLNTIDYTVARRISYSAAACAQTQILCTDTLQTAYAMHSFVRAEIIDQIMNRVVFQTDAHMHFIGLLQRLVADDIDTVRAHASRIVDVLESMAVMAPATVSRLLQAAAPLFLDDPQFRASLILVLRKALFARGTDERRAALDGLFALITSTVQVSAAGTFDSQHLAVLLEVLGLLRRSLTQQPEIRTVAYQRLAVLLDQPFALACPPLLNALYGVLAPEFAKFYQHDHSADSPINIQQCINPATSRVTMPIAGFLLCYAKLVTALTDSTSIVSASDSSSSGSAYKSAADSWEDLCTRFARAQIEDYELDPEGEYSLDSPVGVRNNSTVRLVIGCVDAAIEYALGRGMDGAMNPAQAIELFSMFSRFSEILCARFVDDKRRRVIGSVCELSQISMRTALRVLAVVLPDRQRLNSPGHPLNCNTDSHNTFAAQTGRAELWAANTQFVRHVFEVALAHVSASRTEALDVETHLVLLLAYIAYSGVLVRCANAEQDPIPANLIARGMRSRSLVMVAAEALAACASVLTARNAVGILPVAVMRPSPAMFASNGPTSPPSLSDSVECMVALVAKVRNVVEQLLSLKPVLLREATSLLGALHSLATYLAHVCFHNPSQHTAAYASLNELARWAYAMIDGEIPGDPPLLKGLVALIICCQPFLQSQPMFASSSIDLSNLGANEEPLAVHQDMDEHELGPMNRLVATTCIASRLLTNDAAGSDDEDNMNDEDEPNLNLYTLRTIPALVTLAVTWLKGELQQMDWVIGQLRKCASAELRLRPDHDDEDLHVSIRLERRLCMRLYALTPILMHMLSTQFAGTLSDQSIRIFTDLHRTFALLTRTKLQASELPITESYIECLSQICTTLNQRAFSLVTEKYGRFMADANESKSEKPAKKKQSQLPRSSGGVAKTKMLSRNSVLVSSLIYQMELSEKYVAKLAAKTKTPLAHYLKRSSMHDFRINVADLAEPLATTSHDGYSYDEQPEEIPVPESAAEDSLDEDNQEQSKRPRY
ncbi:hypothetical protein H4R22_003803 [Coemansia sp. RSA 1290]|nr:hypothetical protein H4R22_003803 [Coemansia sp. RSA 1290]KAJ2650009.1 hypothetical protein IWW40_002719 [Coemansia sp. RSA 1250]